MGMVSEVVDVTKVIELRNSRDWTQKQLAEKAGVTPRTIERMEAGDPKSPATIDKVAKALGETYSTLTGKSPPSGLADAVASAPTGQDGTTILVVECRSPNRQVIDAIVQWLNLVPLVNVHELPTKPNLARFSLFENDALRMLSAFEQGVLDAMGVVDVREVSPEDILEDLELPMTPVSPPIAEDLKPEFWAWCSASWSDTEGPDHVVTRYGSDRRIYDSAVFEKLFPGASFLSKLIGEIADDLVRYEKDIRGSIEAACRICSRPQVLQRRTGVVLVDSYDYENYDFGDFPPAHQNDRLRGYVGACVKHYHEWTAAYSTGIAHRETGEPCYLTVDFTQHFEQQFIANNRAMLSIPLIRPVFWIRSMMIGEVRYGHTDLKALLPLKAVPVPLDYAIALHEREKTAQRPRPRN